MALDDVGAAPATLAVLPLVRPDLIKLDMRLLQGRTTTEAAHIVNTARAQAERTDAVVIAEGTETIKPAREAVAAAPPSARGRCSATRRRCLPAAARGGHPPAGPGGRRRRDPWEVVAAAREWAWS